MNTAPDQDHRLQLVLDTEWNAWQTLVAAWSTIDPADINTPANNRAVAAIRYWGETLR